MRGTTSWQSAMTDRRRSCGLLGTPFEPQQILRYSIKSVTLRAGHRYAITARRLALKLCATLSARGFMCVRGHASTGWTFTTPVPLASLSLHDLHSREIGSAA